MAKTSWGLTWRRLVAVLLTFVSVFLSVVVYAGELVKVLSRSDANVTLFWHPTEGATATLFIFPGGGGGFGRVEAGWPSSNNFLVRTAQL